MTTDLDEAVRNNSRAREALDEGASSQALAWCLNAQRAIIRHLRNSPADGKAERGDRPTDDELRRIYLDFADVSAGGAPLRDEDRGNRALYDAGFRAGQQSRLDERERAVVEAARAWRLNYYPLHNTGTIPGALADAVDALDSAAKSDALGEGRKA